MRRHRTSSRVVRIPTKLLKERSREIAQRNGMTEDEVKALVKKRLRQPAQPSALEANLDLQLAIAGLPEPEREQYLVPGRRFRCDRVWRAQWLVVEVEGGTKMMGRHQRPEGFERDTIKYNLLVLAGWRVLRFTGRQVRSGEAVKVIEQALQVSAAAR